MRTSLSGPRNSVAGAAAHGRSYPNPALVRMRENAEYTSVAINFGKSEESRL
jgi:hypothetical protein